MTSDDLRWAGVDLRAQRLLDDLHEGLRQTRSGRLALRLIVLDRQVRRGLGRLRLRRRPG
ncbi:hypothetical protein [Streptomyces sp. NPDC005732]|uniref:hypothetical protein n=1 Tax=Streptomyces sp. NPDC005732 TaxID=3157057 RepID=UPI0033D703A3